MNAAKEAFGFCIAALQNTVALLPPLANPPHAQTFFRLNIFRTLSESGKGSLRLLYCRTPKYGGITAT
ncbi:MAG: hypothetical protein IJK97_11515, partial [Thermoguttaceae bacterium]|nr:hypothetical protein [Thermoguttaceae bacterium]